MATALIDLETDDLKPISELCQRRLGKRMAPATRWRWRVKGVKGAKLESVYVAGVWCTTEAAFAEFIRATTEAATPTPAAPPAERPEATERRLKAAGLL